MTRKQRAGRWTAAGFLMLFVAATGSASTPTDADLQQEIEHRLSKEEVVGFSVEVAVRGDEVTLRGEVPSLWHKGWALDRVGGTDGVVAVVSYLTIRNGDGAEEMARAIFKSWFVDFDPVRAKAEGRQPEGMSAEIAELTHVFYSENVFFSADYRSKIPYDVRWSSNKESGKEYDELDNRDACPVT